MDRAAALRNIAARRRAEQMAAQQAAFARQRAVVAQAIQQGRNNQLRLAELTPEQRARFEANLRRRRGATVVARPVARTVVRTARNARNLQVTPQRGVLNMVGDCWGGVCRGASAIRNYTSRMLRGSQRNASPLAEAATMEAMGAAANAEIAGNKVKIAELQAEINRTMAQIDRTGAAMATSLQPGANAELDALLSGLPPVQPLEETPEFRALFANMPPVEAGSLTAEEEANVQAELQALLGTSATGNSKNKNKKTKGGKRTKRRKYNRK